MKDQKDHDGNQDCQEDVEDADSDKDRDGNINFEEDQIVKNIAMEMQIVKNTAMEIRNLGMKTATEIQIFKKSTTEM